LLRSADVELVIQTRGPAHLQETLDELAHGGYSAHVDPD
jgi:hypothetical protein